MLVRLGPVARWLAGLAVAVGLVAVATALRALMGQAGAAAPFLTFYPAVFLACILGGPGLALPTLALSMVASTALFLPGPWASAETLVALFWFAVGCLTGCAPLILLVRARRSTEATAAALIAGERRFRTATRAASGLIYEWDTHSGRVIRFGALKEMIGRDPEALAPTADAWLAIIHPEDQVRTGIDYGEALARGDDRIETEYRVLHADGHWVHVFDRAAIERDESGGIVRVIGTTIDISARHRLQEKLELALSQREAMIREVHHRVKNSLQTVSSLLSVQAKRMADPAVRAAFQDAIGRIQAIAMVHQALYQDDDLAQVRIGAHLQMLCEHVGALNGEAGRRRVLCRAHTEDVPLTPDEVVPMALIVNELLTNAFKHGYAPEDDGAIALSLEERKDGIRLTVTDDGRGVPPDCDPMAGDTLGMKLVGLLVKQLGGTIRMERLDRGTRFVVMVPPRPPAPERTTQAA